MSASELHNLHGAVSGPSKISFLRRNKIVPSLHEVAVLPVILERTSQPRIAEKKNGVMALNYGSIKLSRRIRCIFNFTTRYQPSAEGDNGSFVVRNR